MMIRRLVLVALALVAALAMSSPVSFAQATDDYRLGSGDRIRLDIVDQPALSGEEMVQADGAIRLSRVGSIRLDGLTLGEAEAAVAARLKSALGLADPDVTIGVAAYRPVFIVGDVQSPGAFPFTPGMTVLHAIALAGGYHRAEPGDAAARLEVGRLLERQEQLADQLAVSYVRLARYEAERDGDAAIRPSSAAASLVTPERLSGLVAQEAAIKTERQTSLDASLKTFEQRRQQLRNEITALEAQRDAKMQLADSLRRERASLDNLIKRELVPTPRVFELERTTISTDADRREVEAYLSRARREIVLADQGELNLRSERQLDILNGIKGARDEIAQQQAAAGSIAAQIEVARNISRAQSSQPDRAGVNFDRLMVKRRGAADFAPIGLTDPLQPDDLVAVPVEDAKAKLAGFAGGQ